MRLSAGLLTVTLQPSGSYSLELADDGGGGGGGGTAAAAVAFASAPLTLLVGGACLSSADGSLVVDGAGLNVSAGSDGIGAFASASIGWRAPSAPALRFSTAVRAYDAASSVVFEQRFESGIASVGGGAVPCSSASSAAASAATAAARRGRAPEGGPSGMIAAFPSLAILANATFGILSFEGQMSGAGYRVGTWPRALGGLATGSGSVGGFATGPHVLVCPSRGCHLVVSALTHALTGFQTLDAATAVVSSGLLDRAASVPAGFSFATLLTASGASPVPPRAGGRGRPPAVAAALAAWGAALLGFHGKARTRPDAHVVLSSLGWNDNAASFYCPLEGRPSPANSTVGNAAAMHLRVAEAAQAAGLPHRFHFITSHWYGERVYGGVSEWTDDAWGNLTLRFPSADGSGGGLAAAWTALAARGVRATSSHLGMWVPGTPYARNASAFGEWFVGNASAVPLSRGFFAWLLGRAAREWGLVVLEQDHMSEQYEGAEALTLGTIDGFERWLAAEAAGADDAGVSIEYCMDVPSIIVNSATVARATHARASGDYVPSQAAWQWEMGVTSALLWAVGLFPSKNVYYSSSAESYVASTDIATDCLFSGFSEPHPLTHHAAAVLSAGLVQPSDGPGAADAALVRTAARSDGLLLKPDRPLMRVEATWDARMFASAGAPPRVGAVSATMASVGGFTWHYIFSANLTEPYAFEPSDLFPEPAGAAGEAAFVVVPSFLLQPAGSWQWSVNASAPFSNAAPLALAAAAGPSDYSVQLALVAPLLPGGAVFFGEIGKLVAMSAQRVTGLSVVSGGVVGGGGRGGTDVVVSVTFTGDAAGETVAFAFACAGSAPQVAACDFPQAARLNFSCAAAGGAGVAQCVHA